MAAATVDDFRTLVQKSGLLSDEQIEAFLAESPLSADDPHTFAHALTNAGLLTPWQRDKLLEGRFKGFFLNKYRILAQLGAGAMGTVFLGEHKVMRHKVAIKVLARRLVGKSAYVKRFEQEARAAAAVNHPRVVRAYDFDCAGDVYFLVMEFAEGEDLQKIVTRDGVLPLPVVAECIAQTAEGLSAAHAAGLVHRDIKPSNLLIDGGGNVRILDLGLARLEDENEPSLTLAYESKMIGTVDFLAPEQARNSHHIDHRADLYSLGCTMYFLLSGQPPFNEGTLTQRVIEHQTKLPIDIRTRRKDCPAELAFICHKLLAKLPEDRFQTAQEVADALRDWANRQAGRSSGGSALLNGSAGLEDLAPLPPGDELSILDVAETSAALETDAAGIASKGTGRGSSLAGGELELADDDVLSPTSSPMASPSRGGSSKSSSLKAPGTSGIGVAAGKSGIGKAAGQSGVGRKAGPGSSVTGKPGSGVRPKPTTQVPISSAADFGESKLPLTSQDSLVQLLAEELPDALVSVAPARGNSLLDPLGRTEESIAAAAAAPAASSGAYAKALADARASQQPSAWSRFKSLVTEEGPGGISYSLWFLVVAGMLLGAIVCGIGYSYYHSTKAPEVIEQTRED
ncbi:MAG: serine/threonine-protein kinase [Pirellulaceae bacterium]|nr:serine/threonine-protein kinase [Pirellulaceae bacterium]